MIKYDFGREYENGFRRRTEIESALPRAPAEVANFIVLFKGGGSKAFERVLHKTNADLAQWGELEAGEDGYHKHPSPGRDDVYDLGYRHKHRGLNQCEKSGLMLVKGVSVAF